MHPRQSVEDYLSAIQEETQQLEEQLASHKQVRHMFCCSVIKNLVCIFIETCLRACLGHYDEDLFLSLKNRGYKIAAN